MVMHLFTAALKHPAQPACRRFTGVITIHTPAGSFCATKPLQRRGSAGSYQPGRNLGLCSARMQPCVMFSLSSPAAALGRNRWQQPACCYLSIISTLSPRLLLCRRRQKMNSAAKLSQDSSDRFNSSLESVMLRQK